MDVGVKIATWNVNSLRARKDLVFDWIEQHEPDVICLQETKVTDQEFPEDEFGDLDYDVVYFGQPSYNGVAIAARDEIEDVVKGFPGAGPDDEKRLIAATIAGIRIIDIYLPNGHALDSDKYTFKLGWVDQLQECLQNGPGPDTELLLCGDFNIVPRAEDCWRGKEADGSLFCSEPERSRYQKLLDWGLHDSLMKFNDAAEQFTWWDYRGGSFEKDHGLRIDHILLTKSLLARAESVTIHREARALEGRSDHVPVVVELAD